MYEDASLLRQYAQERAEDAFAEVVRRHINGVYSAALRRVCGDAHLAEDITQRVFVSLARQAEQVSRHSAVSAWLYITTRNEAANAVRSERRRKARELEAHAMEDRTHDPAATADWSQLAPLLDSVIDQLNNADRTAVVLRYVEQCSYAEVGSVLHVSEDAARMRVDRALDKIRQLMARHGITSTAAALSTAIAQHAVAAAPAGLTASVTAAALAVGPVSALSVAGVIGFMSTSKTLLGVVGMAAVVGLGSAGYQLKELRASEAAVVAAKSENEKLAAGVRVAEARASDAEARAAAARRTVDVQAREANSPPTTPNQPWRADELQQAISQGNALLERHPELLKRVTQLKRAAVEAQFGAWVRRVGLSPATAELFYANMMGDGLVWQGELSDGTRVAVRLSRPSEASAGSAIAELMEKFGGSRENYLRELRGEIFGRELAGQLSSRLYLTSEPLTPEQTDQFVRIAGGAIGRGTPINGNIRIDFEQAIRNSEAILSPTQVNALKSIQRQLEYNAALTQARADASKATKAPTS